VEKLALVEIGVLVLGLGLAEEQLVSEEPVAVSPARLASPREAGGLVE